MGCSSPVASRRTDGVRGGGGWRRLQKVAPDGSPAASAHPARFSPDDKFSKERITTKKRFNLLPTQQPAPVL